MLTQVQSLALETVRGQTASLRELARIAKVNVKVIYALRDKGEIVQAGDLFTTKPEPEGVLIDVEDVTINHEIRNGNAWEMVNYVGIGGDTVHIRTTLSHLKFHFTAKVTVREIAPNVKYNPYDYMTEDEMAADYAAEASLRYAESGAAYEALQEGKAVDADQPLSHVDMLTTAVTEPRVPRLEIRDPERWARIAWEQEQAGRAHVGGEQRRVEALRELYYDPEPFITPAPLAVARIALRADDQLSRELAAALLSERGDAKDAFLLRQAIRREANQQTWVVLHNYLHILTERTGGEAVHA